MIDYALICLFVQLGQNISQETYSGMKRKLSINNIITVIIY